ncbi:hypothetical protein HDU67_005756, partial [Dinochytrium kinnereticum]
MIDTFSSGETPGVAPKSPDSGSERRGIEPPPVARGIEPLVKPTGHIVWKKKGA